MFWGLIMEPQRRYTQKVKKAFHVSMAALDVSTSSEEPAQVMVGFEGRNYLLCTLRKPDMLQCPLDLNFEVGDELSLAANGKCHVHLTGYLIEDPSDLMGEEEEDIEEEESQEKEVKNKSKRNKDIQNGPPLKKTKSSTNTAEEASEEESEDDDSDVDVNALLGKSFDSDEDDETFGSEEEEDQAEEEEDDDDEDGEGLEEEDESSLSEAESDEDNTVQDSKPKMNGSPKKEVQTPVKQKNKKDKKNEQKKLLQNKTDGKIPNKENQSPKAKESSKKILQNGLVIEDLREGQGQPAKPGKFITVYYEGRLKSNNKLFDATKQGAGFSFRLGGGEVIKGWDSGLVGMKIGGKRKLTCPPNMAYGPKGSPPAIPANATLVFEVELKKIR